MVTLYKVTNKLNGKVYIGITKRGLAVRWNQHVKRAFKENQSHYFACAIRKYGPENFTTEVVGEFETHTQAIEAEKTFIALYKSNNKMFGYNLTEGGDGVTMTEEIRNKISVKRRGFKHPPERIEFQRQLAKRTRNRLRKDLSDVLIKELYLSGIGSTTIGKRLGCDKSVVLGRLRKMGVPRR